MTIKEMREYRDLLQEIVDLRHKLKELENIAQEKLVDDYPETNCIPMPTYTTHCIIWA